MWLFVRCFSTSISLNHFSIGFKKGIMTLSEQQQIITLWMDFLDGNELAFSRLYLLFFDDLLMYGRRVGGDDEMVEDVIQDLFVKLYQKKMELNDNTKLRSFLFRALKNQIYNQLLRHSKLRSLEDYDFPFDLNYTIDDEMFSNQAQQLSDEIHCIMKGLTGRQKEIIYLRFVHEMSFEEISEIMDIHVQSARNLLFRSIEKIRKETSMVSFLSVLQVITVQL